MVAGGALSTFHVDLRLIKGTLVSHYTTPPPSLFFHEAFHWICRYSSQKMLFLAENYPHQMTGNEVSGK